MEKYISKYDDDTYYKYLEELVIYLGEELIEEFIIEESTKEAFAKWIEENNNDLELNISNFSYNELIDIFGGADDYILEENEIDTGYKFLFFMFVHEADDEQANILLQEIEERIEMMLEDEQ